MNDPFEDKDHGYLTRAEVFQAVRKYVTQDKFPNRRIETIILPGLDRKDSRPGYVLFK